MRVALRESRLTIDQAADYMARHPNTIRNWLKDSTAPTQRELVRFATMTGVPEAWLRGESPPTIKDTAVGYSLRLAA